MTTNHLCQRTNPASWLKKIMPENPPDNRKRSALVSTCDKTYGGVPHGDTIKLLAKRCEVNSTEPLEYDAFLDTLFKAKLVNREAHVDRKYLSHRLFKYAMDVSLRG